MADLSHTPAKQLAEFLERLNRDRATEPAGLRFAGLPASDGVEEIARRLREHEVMKADVLPGRVKRVTELEALARQLLVWAVRDEDRNYVAMIPREEMSLLLRLVVEKAERALDVDAEALLAEWNAENSDDVTEDEDS